MSNQAGRPQRYSIVVRNRPGELAKLTKFLLDRSANIGDLAVGNAGNRAAIRFSAPPECGLDDGLRQSGFRPG